MTVKELISILNSLDSDMEISLKDAALLVNTVMLMR